jgi:hypothetical protein
VALQLLSPELMRSALCVAVIIAGVVLFSREDSRTVSAPFGPPNNAEIADARDTRRDVYGNEIAPAVGDYFVDPYGEMYERHAPDTALPEIGEPES